MALPEVALPEAERLAAAPVGEAEPDEPPGVALAVLLEEFVSNAAVPDAVLERLVVASANSLFRIVEGVTDKLDVEAFAGKMAWIRISWHWPPIYSSYRFPKAPLMHRHHLVVPPIAREPFLQTEKPPV